MLSRGITTTITANITRTILARRKIDVLLLVLLTLLLSFALYRAGGVIRDDWYPLAAGFGMVSIALLAQRKFKIAPPLPGSLRVVAVLLPVYLVFQVIPLPVRMIAAVSPARAAMERAMAIFGPASAFAPISVIPHTTFLHFLQAATCSLVFVSVRQGVWNLGARPWAAAWPLILLGAMEALLGLAQSHAAQAAPGAAGTFINHNHFAGFLEMVLPFAVLCPVGLWEQMRGRGAWPVLGSCCSIAAAAVILAAILRSFSRMGFLAALVGLCVSGTGILLSGGWLAKLGRGKRFAIIAAAGAALIAAGLVYLPPDQLVRRFGASDIRWEIWKESLPLTRVYWLFGCGSGGYESVFMKYKVTDPMFRIDYAHNDYLQRFIELGAAGSLVAGYLIFAVLRESRRAAATHASRSGRALAIACLASLAAILLHSTVDFSLYIPANALVFAWICGMAVSVMFSSQPWRTIQVQPSRNASVSLGGRI
jgi:putative inorganic carbon (hco3(-)) transporter